MVLKTLGGLSLEGSDFKQSRPLLLLAYLCLKGSQEKRHLAELFWPHSQNAMGNLNTVLSRLTKVDDFIEIQGHSLSSKLSCDALELRAALENQDYAKVLNLYQGRFLEGFYLKAIGEELEDWLYQTREAFATKVSLAKLNQAEQKAREGLFTEAAKEAEQAYLEPSAGEPTEVDLERIYRLLVAGQSRLADDVKNEAASFGLNIELSKEEAQKDLEQAKKAVKIPNNLPTYGTSFVGRKRERTELFDLLNQQDKRMITIVGLGGLGKTRLALQVGKHHLNESMFPEGVYFIALDTVTDSDSIPYQIAQALDFSLSSHPNPLEQLTSYLQNKQLLLILDNYEHLLESAFICSKLVQTCSQLHLLVTSRERLHLESEWVYSLKGLGVQLEADVAPPSHIKKPNENQEALMLFEQRAQKADLTFKLTPQHQKAVLDICELVGGSPLAIELAATWTRLLNPIEIVEELSSNFDLLTSSNQDVPDRHQSIKVVLGSSWQKLSSNEKEVMSRLSVFHGGFTRDSAGQIANASLSTLASLLDKALIRAEPARRYTLHPLVRQFAHEKLVANQHEYEQTQERHSNHFCQILSDQEAPHLMPELVSSETVLSTMWEERVKASVLDYDNVLAAWRWLIKHKSSSDFFLIANGLEILLYYLGNYTAGLALISDAIEKLKGQEYLHIPSYAYLLFIKASFLNHLSQEIKEQHTLLQESYNLLSPEFESHLAFYRVVNHQASGELELGHIEEAKRLVNKAQALLKNHNAPFLEADIHLDFGKIAQKQGKYTEAKHNFETALRLFRKLKLRFPEAITLILIGNLTLDQEDLQEAEHYLTKMVKLSKETGYMAIIPYSLDCLARIALERKQFNKAISLCQEGIALNGEHGPVHVKAHLLMTLGRVAMAQEEHHEATSFLLQALKITSSIEDDRLSLWTLVFLAELRIIQGRFKEASKWLKLVERSTLTEPWIKKKASQLQDDLKIEPNKSINENIHLEAIIKGILHNQEDTV